MQNLQPDITIRPRIADPVLKNTEPDPYLGDFPQQKERWDMKKISKPVLLVAVLISILAGVATGVGLKNFNNPGVVAENSDSVATQKIAGDNVKAGDVFGSNIAAFKDTAEGLLEAGGINGEGSHKLLRTGGVSQTVYLTSSVTDLDKLVGMQVKVWGETYQGQKAGWLMDVGKVEVVDPAPPAPTTTE